MARLLLGVSGGIAAYKALETARLAVLAGHSVRVLQTPASERFVGRASFEAITGAPVLGGEFEPDPSRGAYPGEPVPHHAPISHLALADRAEVYLIAPASANTVAKLATGQADNLLLAAALAARCPIVVAPAMNGNMFTNPATQANMATLRERGVVVLPPGVGELASHGERGIGRLPEPSELLAACEALLSLGSWTGRRVLVSAGGTREPLDSVRFIGNRSSGRMGIALASRAAARGAQVTLIAANVTLAAPPGVRVVEVQTAAELLEACRTEFPQTDVLLMAAAVSDFKPAAPVVHKLKKGAGVPPPVELEPTPDVLSALRDLRRPGQVVVGFAAEHGAEAVGYGRRKLVDKELDAIVVNDISRGDIGFESEDNEVTVITHGQEIRVARASKERVADAVLDALERLTPGEELRGAGRTRAADGSRV